MGEWIYTRATPADQDTKVVIKMFQNELSKRKLSEKRSKWAKAAGDHETVSAMGTKGAGKYMGDLDCETSENIRFKPAGRKESRVKSVRPSCCAKQEEQPKLAG